MGSVAQAVVGTDNAISTVERGDCAFGPCLSSRGSSILITIRNMPPLTFGIHNEQYGCNMVII